MGENVLLAGAGRAQVQWNADTFPLEGFTGVHDSVSVRAMYCRGEMDILFLSLEMTSLPDASIRHFKELAGGLAGIPAERVLVSVTHTFSVPHLPRGTETPEEQHMAEVLYGTLDTAVTGAVTAAVNSAAPVTMNFSTVSCGINVNRNIEGPEGWWIGRNEGEYSSHEVQVLTLYQEKKPVASLINYDCQPSVLDHVETRDGQKLISGDLAGAMMRTLEEKYTGLTAIFLPGAAGDQSPLVRGVMEEPDGTEHCLYEDAYVFSGEFGRYLAECVEGAIRHGEQVPAEGPLRAEQTEISLPEQVMRYGTRDLRPHKTYDFELTGRYLPAPVTLLTIGEVKLLLTAPELNSEYGSQLRILLGGKVMLGTLVDGAMKYMPQEQDFERITYTAMNTMIGRGADQIFLEGIKHITHR